MYDYHVHSSFSDDCTADMEDMILSACDKGFGEIALTDHIDLQYPDPDIPFTLDFPAYHKALEHYQIKYKDRIKLLKGIEVGVQAAVSKENADIIHAYPYDFVIASFHAAEGKDLYTGGYYKGKTALQCYRDFYSYVYQCLKTYKDYNILGHLNIVARYSQYMPSEPVGQELYLDLVEDILRLVIEDGKGIASYSCFVHTSQLYLRLKCWLCTKIKGGIIRSDRRPFAGAYRFHSGI